jgi:hypothetical protein
MKSIDIRAISGNHALLKQNAIPTIGRVETKKRKTLKGELVIISDVIFHYENKNSQDHFDHFQFVEGKLLYYIISKYTPEYINKAYEECIIRERLIDEFVNKITSTYVFHELGF